MTSGSGKGDFDDACAFAHANLAIGDAERGRLGRS